METVSLGQKGGARSMTAADIVRRVSDQIRRGDYPVGAQLPTVRELAQELGVNKNTVGRAYQMLQQQGYLDVTQGRGAFVRALGEASEAAVSQWQARVEGLVLEAQRLGLDRARVAQVIQQTIDRVYGTAGLRLAFVECNTQDVEELGAELGQAVGHRLEGVLLGDALAQPADLAARYDLIVTTFYHLAQLRRALGPEAADRLIGVHAMPGHDALLRLARLDAAVIGLVCEFPSTVDNLSHTVSVYHPDATVLPALIEDEARLQTLLAKADAIVVTRSCTQRVQAFHPTQPVISVAYHIDQQSVDFLRSRISEVLSREC